MCPFPWRCGRLCQPSLLAVGFRYGTKYLTDCTACHVPPAVSDASGSVLLRLTTPGLMDYIPHRPVAVSVPEYHTDFLVEVHKMAGVAA